MILPFACVEHRKVFGFLEQVRVFHQSMHVRKKIPACCPRGAIAVRDQPGGRGRPPLARGGCFFARKRLDHAGSAGNRIRKHDVLGHSAHLVAHGVAGALVEHVGGRLEGRAHEHPDPLPRHPVTGVGAHEPPLHDALRQESDVFSVDVPPVEANHLVHLPSQRHDTGLHAEDAGDFVDVVGGRVPPVHLFHSQTLSQVAAVGRAHVFGLLVPPSVLGLPHGVGRFFHVRVFDALDASHVDVHEMVDQQACQHLALFQAGGRVHEILDVDDSHGEGTRARKRRGELVPDGVVHHPPQTLGVRVVPGDPARVQAEHHDVLALDFLSAGALDRHDGHLPAGLHRRLEPQGARKLLPVFFLREYVGGTKHQVAQPPLLQVAHVRGVDSGRGKHRERRRADVFGGIQKFLEARDPQGHALGGRAGVVKGVPHGQAAREHHVARGRHRQIVHEGRRALLLRDAHHRIRPNVRAVCHLQAQQPQTLLHLGPCRGRARLRGSQDPRHEGHGGAVREPRHRQAARGPARAQKKTGHQGVEENLSVALAAADRAAQPPQHPGRHPCLGQQDGLRGRPLRQADAASAVHVAVRAQVGPDELTEGAAQEQALREPLPAAVFGPRRRIVVEDQPGLHKLIEVNGSRHVIRPHAGARGRQPVAVLVVPQLVLQPVIRPARQEVAQHAGQHVHRPGRAEPSAQLDAEQPDGQSPRRRGEDRVCVRHPPPRLGVCLPKMAHDLPAGPLGPVELGGEHNLVAGKHRFEIQCAGADARGCVGHPWRGDRRHHRQAIPDAQPLALFRHHGSAAVDHQEGLGFGGHDDAPGRGLHAQEGVAGSVPRQGGMPRDGLQRLPGHGALLVHGQRLSLPGGERQVAGVVFEALDR